MKPKGASRNNLQLDDAVMLILSANDNEIDGRTTLQKLVYLCSNKIPIDGAEDFRPGYYGPYSGNLSESIERSVGLKFLKEESRITSRDHVSYLYRLTNDALEIISKMQANYNKEFKVISEIVGDAKSFCNLNPYALSYAAKVHYIAKQTNRPISLKDAAQKARSFDWKLDENQAESGIKLLLALKFAKPNHN